MCVCVLNNFLVVFPITNDFVLKKSNENLTIYVLKKSKYLLGHASICMWLLFL